MKLSVVIVNWNVGELLHRCVHSVVADQVRSGMTDIEIIVVDNASSDGSLAPVAAAFPSVRAIQNPENLGFARGTNQAIRHSSGLYVLLLNPDTELLPGALSEMMRFMDTHPGAGAAGAMLLNGDGSLQVSAYPEPTLFREAWRLFHLDGLWPVGSYHMTAWRTDTPREVEVLMGACIMVRREVLDQCGLLDESHFIYSEDQDLCRKLRSKGWRIFWVPLARVRHYGGQSTKQVKAEMFLRLYREKIAYFRTHHGRGAARTYKLVLFAASMARQIMSPLALLFRGNRRDRALELARLYRRLVRELRGL
ncbi:MAG: glycosyltransferase family 2 protein [Acidobacteria bacterium]|nr:glycosyltransferase family 2 protein [Acidobacteriota bacterium]